MQTSTDAKQQILMLKQLPPLSATAARLLESLSDDNVSLNSLATIIGQDPAITARILGVANSAYFGQTKPILSVQEAIIRVLGLNMVKSLAFSIAVSSVFNTAGCSQFDVEAYWSDSLATAMLSREICAHLGTGDQPDLDGVYLAGLLFDIGTLVLVHLFPDDYAKAIVRLRQSPQADVSLIEEETVGISSQQAGAWLTDRWHLPPVVVRVVAQSPMDDCRREVAAVSLSSRLIRSRTPVEAAMPSIPEALSGLTAGALNTVYQACRLREAELHTLASLMVK